MNLPTPSQLARVLSIATLSVVALSATTVPKQVHPLTANPNAPVRIAIIADHYTLAEKEEFNYDVENFIKYGLLADGFYQTQAGSIDIVSYFDETPVGQDSRFGFVLGPGDGNCAVTAPTDILLQLHAALGTPTPSPLPTRYVVLANHPYNIGCTDGDWSYVAVDAVGTDVFQHELGHLIGYLYDEWAMPSYGGTSHPGLASELFNCATTPSAGPPVVPEPYWMNYPTKFPGAAKLPGCDLYMYGVVHPYDHCRMGAMNHKNFCLVCQELMRKGFSYANSNPTPTIASLQPQPSHVPAASSRFRIMNAAFVTTAQPQPPAPAPPPSNPPRPVMRLVVEFDPGSSGPPERVARLESKQRIFSTSVYVPNHRRAGQFLYEISDKDGVRDVAIIPDIMFRSRSFQGGPHATGPVKPVQLFMDLPNEDQKSALIPDRNLKVIIYRLPRTVTDEIIDKARWAQLKDNPDHKIATVATLLLPPQQPAAIKE